MTDEPEDLIVHLLHDIRAEVGALRDEQGETRQRVGKLPRRMDESVELMTQAMGFAALSNMRTDNFDDRVATVEDGIVALQNQIRDLRR